MEDQTPENGGGGGSGGTPASSRWNPTKEQVNMLEGLYRQGIRTPSADQIQQITSRLRAFGHIEGKNVFYWFQNHKARQRQKQKQENMNRHSSIDNLHRFLHHRSSLFPSATNSPNNVVCGQYYVPIQTQISDPVGTFDQNMLPIKTTCRRPQRLEKVSENGIILSSVASPTSNHVPQPGFSVDYGEKTMMKMRNNQQTLPLFPLSPTGVLRHQQENPNDHHHHHHHTSGDFSIKCYDGLSAAASGFEEGCSSAGGGDTTFYDFFSR